MGFLTILVALSAAAMASAETTPLDNDNFEVALSLWFSDKDQCISEYGHISDWDTSGVTWMAKALSSKFEWGDDDISKWDVSSVTSMNYRFQSQGSFNSDLSKWDVGNVVDLGSMFWRASSFNSDLSKWNVDSCTTMTGMFWEAKSFNSDLSKWNMEPLLPPAKDEYNTRNMFTEACSYDCSPAEWSCPLWSCPTSAPSATPTASPTEQGHLEDFNFYTALKLWFTDQDQCMIEYGNISDWDTSRVTHMRNIFTEAEEFGAYVIEDLSKWDVSKVTSMDRIFEEAKLFTSDLSKWEVGKVTMFDRAFRKAEVFNSDLSKWDISSATDTVEMFLKAKAFDSDLSKWNNDKITQMGAMFKDTCSYEGCATARWTCGVHKYDELTEEMKQYTSGVTPKMDRDACDTRAPSADCGDIDCEEISGTGRHAPSFLGGASMLALVACIVGAARVSVV